MNIQSEIIPLSVRLNRIFRDNGFEIKDYSDFLKNHEHCYYVVKQKQPDDQLHETFVSIDVSFGRLSIHVREPGFNYLMNLIKDDLLIMLCDKVDVMLVDL